MRYIVAARLSRKPRPGEDIEYPITEQDKRGIDWGIEQGWTHVGSAADYKTGTVPPWDRPDLRAWVTEPEKMARYDAIVAFKTDRISRGTDEDFSTIEAWASEHGKKLVIVGPDGGIQYPSRNDSDFWQWTATKRQARKEWEDIRSRIMARTADLRAHGKLVGRPAFGFAVAGTKYDKRLEPTEIGLKYVPLIFQRIAKGDSLMAVARWLDSEGVHPNSKAATNWSPTSISQMIRNRVYVGQRKRTEIREGKGKRGTGATLLTVTPLVDAKLWTDANARLDNSPRGRRGPATGEKTLLSGTLKCGNCGAPMYPITPRDKVLNYRCHGFPPQHKGCGVMVPASVVDEKVDRFMRLMPGFIPEMIRVPGVNPAERLAEIDLELRDLPAKGLPYAEEDAERARLRSEKDNLPEGTPDEWALVPTKLEYAAKWIASDKAGRRAMLRHVKVTFKWGEDRRPIVDIIAPRVGE